MPSFNTLEKNLSKVSAQGRKSKAHVDREVARGHLYHQGGKPFLRALRKYGRTERGEELLFDPWFAEYCEAIGDVRISHTITTGCAQLGKTLAHTLLNCFWVAIAKLNTLWCYDQERTLLKCVPLQFRPTMEKWLEEMGEKSLGGGPKSYKLFQVLGANAMFTFVNTSTVDKSSAKAGLANAGSAVTSVTADAMILEERSQYKPGTADPLPRRLDASTLPSRPIRELGTPGAGMGIEANIEHCHHEFYPHFTCPGCGRSQPLHPKGCLLRSVQKRNAKGHVITTYLSASGRPLTWWHSDEATPIDSAYFACAHCGDRLPDEVRFAARYQCLKTGITLRAFLNSLVPGVQATNWSIAMHISPLLRRAQYNLAAQIIREGLTVHNTSDWQQQALGCPSESDNACITPQMLRAAIAAPIPSRPPDRVVAGVDVGRAEDWLAVVGLWFPEGYEKMIPAQAAERTIRVPLWIGDVMRDEMPAILERFGVVGGLIDNEPSRQSSMKICENTVLEMADQVGSLPTAPCEMHTVTDGGIVAECWRIETYRFQDAVLEGFLLEAADGHPLYRLPRDRWEGWLIDQSERSPAVHLTSPSRDLDGIWSRGKANDLFIALHFAEAYLYLLLNDLTSTGGKPSACYPAFHSKRHTLPSEDCADYPYLPDYAAIACVNFAHFTAIVAYQYEGLLMVERDFKESSLDALARSLRQWQLDAGCKRAIAVCGDPDAVHWDAFWAAARQHRLQATQRFSHAPDHIESVRQLNAKFAHPEPQILLKVPACNRLLVDLQRHTIWSRDRSKPAGATPTGTAWSDCLRWLVWTLDAPIPMGRIVAKR